MLFVSCLLFMFVSFKIPVLSYSWSFFACFFVGLSVCCLFLCWFVCLLANWLVGWLVVFFGLLLS